MVCSTHETLDLEVMLKRYVNEEYWQQSQNHLRYREKCVNGRYVPSPVLGCATDGEEDLD